MNALKAQLFTALACQNPQPLPLPDDKNWAVGMKNGGGGKHPAAKGSSGN